jgi:hypothetical protein
MKGMAHAPEAVEVWVRIEKDAEGYPKSQDWEDLWAWPLDEGTVRVASAPFFAKGVAAGDVFTIVQTAEGFTMLDSVVERSGHSTFRIWVDEACGTPVDQIRRDLERAGAKTELTLDRLIAVDVPRRDEPTVWEYLKTGEQRGDWGIQVGHAPE